MAAETARANLLKVKDGAVEIKPQDAIVVVKTPENTIQLKSDFEYSPDGICSEVGSVCLLDFYLEFLRTSRPSCRYHDRNSAWSHHRCFG
jgi:hypothetical protein